MEQEQPWREITPDDFSAASWRLSVRAENSLLSERDAGGFRLRLVLREANDLKHWSRRSDDPLFLHNYRYGRGNILRGADEVVIERFDGSRYRVDRTALPWTTHPIEEPVNGSFSAAEAQ